MSLELIQNKILPQLLKNQVVKITLTGGEPLCNPQIKDIVQLLLDNHIGVCPYESFVSVWERSKDTTVSLYK